MTEYIGLRYQTIFEPWMFMLNCEFFPLFLVGRWVAGLAENIANSAQALDMAGARLDNI